MPPPPGALAQRDGWRRRLQASFSTPRSRKRLRICRVYALNSGRSLLSTVRGRGRSIVIDFRDRPRPRRHDDDPVGEEDRLLDAVRDEHGGLALFQPDALQIEIHLVTGQRIERTEWLVHQQNLGIVNERAAERDPLLHPAGELERKLAFEAAEPDLRQGELSRARQNRGPAGGALRSATGCCPAPCAIPAAPASGIRCRCR